MIARYFVVEGQTDEVILKYLLPEALLKDTRIIVAGGYSAALSAVQTLFTLTPLPITLFFDTDSCSKEKVEEKKDFINSYLQRTSHNELVLCPMKPEMEILFFYKKELLEKLINSSISDELWYQGKYEPKQVLIELVDNKNYLSFLEKNLTNDIVQKLQQNPLISNIVQAYVDASVVNNNAIAA